MTWGLVIANPAVRQLRRVPHEDRNRIKLAFGEMLTDPFAGDVKPLAGAEGHLRRRIGDWRIFFELLPDQRLIVVKSVKRRGSKTY